MQTTILTFIIPVIALIFTAVFFALWWSDRKQLPVLAFAFCFGSMALGVVINIWIFAGLDPIGVVAYHLLSMAGMLALLWGAARRSGVRPPMIACIVSVLITLPILWYAVVVGAIDAMKMAQNTNSALIICVTALTLWYGQKRNWADHALIWVLCLLGGFGFVRPLMTVFANTLLGPTEAGSTILTSIHVLVLATLLTLMALCLIASVMSDNIKREREDAATDPLSGLPNRKAFESQAARLLDRARSEAIPVSLIVADIDHFKRINDTWGHATGDRVIKSFGELITAKSRPSDLTGRIGGEEFSLIVWNCEVVQAEALANRIREAVLHFRTRKDEDNVKVSASFGVTAISPSDSYRDAFERADQALYSAKRSGRNRVETWPSKAKEGSAVEVDYAADLPVDNVVSLAR